MIIDNDRFDFSLNNTSKLKKLIIENPDLPLIIFCGEDSWHDEWAYEMVYAGEPSIEFLTVYDGMWMDKDDYGERLADDLCDEEEYKDLSDKEFDKMIDQKVAETEFCKAIVIYVG